MTKPELEELVKFLRKWNVSSFSENGICICFYPQKKRKKSSIVGQTGIKTEKVNDVVVPQSIEEEAGMSIEQILHWSSESVPLTDTSLGVSPQTGVGELNEK